MRWERGSSLSVSTRSPSLYHSIVGVGRPSALQFRVVGSPLETITSEGCSTIRGGKSSWRRRDPRETGEREERTIYFNFRLHKEFSQVTLLMTQIFSKKRKYENLYTPDIVLSDIRDCIKAKKLSLGYRYAPLRHYQIHTTCRLGLKEALLHIHAWQSFPCSNNLSIYICF